LFSLCGFEELGDRPALGVVANPGGRQQLHSDESVSALAVHIDANQL
tara:strand:+ start:265 stop:405 length:141 start_codon:yes stop_codon:yes gene_type:complete